MANGHVITCEHCHYGIPKSHNGDPFHETDWKAPSFDLDINWYTKTPEDICNRVRTNLPTPELRHAHFHEDARLHWAIEEPRVMGTILEPAAEPQDWEEFLRRVDRWNEPGLEARCP